MGWFRGQIYRVEVKHFMGTTEFALQAHPKLNFLIGANGVGKSTCMNAIRVGLSTAAKFSGMTKPLSDFIQNGSERATITIYVVERDTNDSTVPCSVFRREITRSGTNGATSKYHYASATRLLRGSPVKIVNATDYSASLSRFNIDTGSLMQVMSQETADHLARATNTERLDVLQGSIEESKYVHQLRSAAVAVRSLHEENAEALAGVRAKANRASTEADRTRNAYEVAEQQKERTDKYRRLEIRRLWRIAEESRLAAESANKQLEAATTELAEVEAEYEKAKEKSAEDIAAAAAAEQNYQGLRGTADAPQRTMRSLLARLSEARHNAEEAANSLRVAEDREKRDAEVLAELQQALEAEEAHSASTQALLDEVTETERKCADDLSRVRNEFRAIESQQAPLRADVNERSNAVSALSAEQQRLLESRNGRIAGQARTVVVEAMNNVSSRNAGDIFGPVAFLADFDFVPCDATTPNGTHWAHQHLTKGTAQSITSSFAAGFAAHFVAVTKDGNQFLTTVSRASTVYLDNPSTPVPSFDFQSAHQHHILGSPFCFLRGHPVVLRALALLSHCDSVPIVTDIDIARNLIGKNASIFMRNCNKPIRRVMVCGEGGTRVVEGWTSRSGAKNVQVSELSTRESFVMHNPVVMEIQSLKARREQLNAEYGAAQNRLSELQPKLTEAKQALDRAQQIHMDARARSNEIRSKMNAFRQRVAGISHKIRSHQQERENEDPAEYRRRLTQATVDAVSLSKQTLRTVLECSMLSGQLAEAKREVEVALDRRSESAARCSSLDMNVKSRTEAVRAIRNRHVNILRDAESSQVSAEHFSQFSRNSPEFAELDDLMSKTSEEWATEVQTAEKMLSMLRVDHVAVQRHISAVAELSKLQPELKVAEADVQRLARGAASAKKLYVDALQEHVSVVSGRFAELMKRFSAHGFVRLVVPGDFNAALLGVTGGPLDIEGAQLRLETSFHSNSVSGTLARSGGENSVTSLAFALALHSVSLFSFRLVDEINQAMDDHNERNAHRIIVGLHDSNPESTLSEELRVRQEREEHAEVARLGNQFEDWRDMAAETKEECVNIVNDVLKECHAAFVAEKHEEPEESNRKRAVPSFPKHIDLKVFKFDSGAPCQYFVGSPKLPNELVYTKDMAIHAVFRQNTEMAEVDPSSLLSSLGRVN